MFGLRLWNHWTTRPAFVYSPAYWTMVFPLGIYTAATNRLAEALPLPALQLIPTYFIFSDLATWLLTWGGCCTTSGYPLNQRQPRDRYRCFGPER